mgnify:CR=1 FL=1
MNRKIISMAMALMMVFCFAAAAYASAPSITTQDLVRVVTTTTTTTPSTPSRTVTIEDSDTPLAGGWTVNVISNIPFVEAEMEKIVKYVTENNLPPADYFGDAVKAQLLQLLPAGTNLDNFALNELITAQLDGYNEAYGDVEVTFDFASAYEKDQLMVAVMGVYDAQGNAEWVALAADVDAETGLVKVTFTKDALAKAASNPYALAILSEI